MFFYYAFPVFVGTTAVLLGSLCRWRVGRFFGWWSGVSIALGVCGSFIPWRGASGFQYGWGSPVPVVVWERSDGGYDDFPVPAGPFMNAVVVFALGVIFWWGAVMSRRFLLRNGKVDA